MQIIRCIITLYPPEVFKVPADLCPLSPISFRETKHYDFHCIVYIKIVKTIFILKTSPLLNFIDFTQEKQGLLFEFILQFVQLVQCINRSQIVHIDGE